MRAKNKARLKRRTSYRPRDCLIRQALIRLLFNKEGRFISETALSRDNRRVPNSIAKP